MAEALAENEATIVEELNAVQGDPVDLGGYYRPDPERAEAAMRPSPTLKPDPRRHLTDQPAVTPARPRLAWISRVAVERLSV